MKPDVLEQKFEKMGATITIGGLPRTSTRGAIQAGGGHRIDMRGERFFLSLGRSVKAEVVDIDPNAKHLLLLVRDAEKHKYLCGHDERHWFVAGVPATAKTVTHAMELLQPKPIREALKRKGIHGSKRFKRRNEAYIRQGEWFFEPVPDKMVSNRDVVCNEPIRRGRSKPHMCQFLYRSGGTRVFVCSHYPNGITSEKLHESWTKEVEGFRSREERRFARHTRDLCEHLGRWMVRDADVFVKGEVSHPDHATIKLKGWHRVYLNNEVFREEFQAFLD